MSFWWNKFLLKSRLYRLFPSCRRRVAPIEEHLGFLSDRLLSAPREIFDDTFRPELHGPDTIHLAQSHPPLNFLPISSVSRVPKSVDLQGLSELRREIRDRIYFEHGDQAELLITSGATAAFATVMDSFINPGDRVVLFDPTSPIFPLGLKHRRAKVQWVASRVEAGKLRYDPEHLRRTLRGSKLLILCNPTNPTGAVFPQENLEPIAFWANKYDVLVYLDESFGPFRYDSAQPKFATLPHARNRCLSVRSCSTAYGLSAAPVGCLAGCDSLIRACRVTQGLQTTPPSPLAQQVALETIQTRSAGLEKFATELKWRANQAIERLTQVGLKPVQPAAGYFLWVPVDVLRLTGRVFARELLVSKRVLVQAGDLFGPSGKQFIRISFALEEGRLREGLKRLMQFVEERRSQEEIGHKKETGNLSQFSDVV